MKPIVLLTLLKLALLCLPASAQTLDIDLRARVKLTIPGTEIPQPAKKRVCEVHSLLEYTNGFDLLQAAIDASGAEYQARFIYASIPHWQSDDTDILTDFGWLDDAETALSVNADYLWDLEYWTGTQANTTDWPPLTTWRNNDIANRASSLPQPADKYTLEYSRICNNYGALVLDRVNRLKGANLPAGCRIGVYAECQVVQSATVSPNYDREDQFRVDWCGKLSQDGNYQSLLHGTDFMYLATHQLNDTTLSDVGWEANKADIVPVMRRLGWTKRIGCGLETAMQSGGNAGVPRTKEAYLAKLNILKDAGADEIYLVEFYNGNPGTYSDARDYQQATAMDEEDYAGIFEAVTQFLRDQL